MPLVSANPTAGPIDFFYTISTPDDDNAPRIDASVPTILFIHGAYGDQVTQHHHFTDPNLRRFNCVALDTRDHGRTRNAFVEKGYDERQAADDLAAFMDALDLPPCHVLGGSSGSVQALALAVLYPNKVLSLFLVSPVCLEEPELAANGRKEIYACFEEAFKSTPVDEEAIRDATFGGKQLSLGEKPLDNLVEKIMYRALAIDMKAWGVGRTASLEHVVVDLLCNRTFWSTEALSNIRGPIFLVHASLDIAYSLEYVQELQEKLRAAGLQVEMHELEGATHYPCLDQNMAKACNELLVQFVRSIDGTVPGTPKSVQSPWVQDLLDAGWNGHIAEDSDSD